MTVKRKLLGLLSIASVMSLAHPILIGDDNTLEKRVTKNSTLAASEPTLAASATTNSATTTTNSATANRMVKKTTRPSNVSAKKIEMFDAMDNGLITVDYIGRDATQANLIFRNQGKEPLDIVLPATFGAVPVLAQGFPPAGNGIGQGFGVGPGLGAGQGGGQGIGGGIGGGGNVGAQGFGQGFGQGIGQGNGQGGGVQGAAGGGFFRVEPDKPRKMSVATICLDHGKADPNPRMKYKVVRLAEANESKVIEGFCRGLADRKISQNVSQAAAWHVANGMSWDELIQKPKVVSQYTGIEMFFSKSEIEAAKRLTELVAIEAKSLAVLKSSIHENSEYRGKGN